MHELQTSISPRINMAPVPHALWSSIWQSYSGVVTYSHGEVQDWGDMVQHIVLCDTYGSHPVLGERVHKNDIPGAYMPICEHRISSHQTGFSRNHCFPPCQSTKHSCHFLLACSLCCSSAFQLASQTVYPLFTYVPYLYYNMTVWLNIIWIKLEWTFIIVLNSQSMRGRYGQIALCTSRTYTAKNNGSPMRDHPNKLKKLSPGLSLFFCFFLASIHFCCVTYLAILVRPASIV
jgi:hypothetical protein